MSFVYTTAIKKLRTLTKRTRVVPGGTSAGKTYGILPILIDQAARLEGLEISVVSETIPHLRKGALKDFLKIMKDTGRYIDAHYNRTLLTYTFSTGSYIEFFSADQEGKVRGPRRTHMYINECNNISFDTYFQLSIRTSDVIWLDFNPTHEFWAHKELKNDPDVEWLTLTYLDNEGLSDVIKKEIEKARDRAGESDYWANWWNVYGLGLTGSLQGVVFSNWDTVDRIPEGAKLIAHGMDFGYTNDPTTLVAAYMLDNEYYYDELLYRKGLSNSDLAAICKQHGLNQSTIVYADSADPKSIAELRTYGIFVMGAEKGKDSIQYGIGLMQEGRFHVTKRSINLIDELRNYTWMVEKDGSTSNVPIDAYNHCFIGSTEIETPTGKQKIEDIRHGDFVCTSQGKRQVLKKWHNGLQQVNKYTMQFDTFSLSLICTEDHLVKTETGWKKIKDLKPDNQLFLHSHSTGKHISYTQTKGITARALSGCIAWFGNTTTGQFLKATIYTMSTPTLTTTVLRTLNLWKDRLTLVWSQSGEQEKIPNGLKRFMLRGLKKQRSGTPHPKAGSGTVSKGLSHTKPEPTESIHANSAGKNTKLGIPESQSFAIKTARLKHVHVECEGMQEVFDLYVAEDHEYFANGILVHNCIDSLRYIHQSRKRNTGKYVIR